MKRTFKKIVSAIGNPIIHWVCRHGEVSVISYYAVSENLARRCNIREFEIYSDQVMTIYEK